MRFMNDNELEYATQKTKGAITIKEQIETLKNRGLIIKDEQEAKRFLERVNYYRLSGYFRQFYKAYEYEKFRDNLEFSLVTNLYSFDKKLRALLFELIAEIEISFKARLSDKLGCDYGDFSWSDENFYDSRTFIDRKSGAVMTYFDALQRIIKRKINRARKEPFVQHHIEQYNYNFPVWVLMEIIDFSDVSKIYKNLMTPIQKDITQGFYKNVSYFQVESWLEQIVKCRNICAHHGRIIAKENFKVKQHKKIKQHNAEGLLALLIAIKLLINEPNIWKRFLIELELLIKTYEIDLKMINFNDDWQSILK